MLTSRAHLLRLRHDPALDFNLAEVEYVDRGAPGDLSRISGDKIIKLEQGWMQIAAVDGVKFIPFHRIRAHNLPGVSCLGKERQARASKRFILESMKD